jgi:hypothetical protein
MQDPSRRRRNTVFLTAAVLLTVSGALSLLGNTSGYTDALFEPDYTLQTVPPDGVLAEAGFLPGDSVITVEGIPVAELGMYSRWPRSLARAPGESLTMTVERDGDMVTGEIVYREQPPGIRKMQFGLLVVLLAFLWSGVWALFFIPSPHSGRLAVIGLAAGLSVPIVNAGSWAGVTGHINVAAEVLWILLLLRFFLFFPKAKEIARAHFTTVLIYAPWVILVGCLVVELLFHPRFYHTFGGLIGLLLLGYLLLALAALVHSWAKIPKKELGPSGLGWILAGFGLGLGGVLLWAVDALLLQGFDVPGSNWAPILFGMIPIGMALGVRRAAGRQEAS